MPKLSGPVREVARLLDLVPYLDTHQHVSISELAEVFGTTPDEMQKSVATLSMCGYSPYDFLEVNYESGFVTISQHDDVNFARALTAEETISLILGLGLLSDSIPAHRNDLLVVHAELLMKLKALVGDVVRHSHSPNSDVENEIARAITSRSSLCISYTSVLNDVTEERIIEPINLYEESGKTYCESYCQRAEDFRTFRVDRMKILEILEPKRSKDSLFQRISRRVRGSKQFSTTVVIHQALRFNSELLKISHLDRKSRGTVHAFSPEWVGRAILSTGGEVELLDDLALRSQISARASEILSLYKD